MQVRLQADTSTTAHPVHSLAVYVALHRTSIDGDRRYLLRLNASGAYVTKSFQDTNWNMTRASTALSVLFSLKGQASSA